MRNRKGYKLTQIGEIPEEWRCEKVGNVAKIKRGAGYQYIKKKENDKGGIPLIRISDFKSFQPITVSKTNDIMRYRVTENDILFAGTGTAGITMFIDKQLDGYAHSYNALRITPNNNKIHPKFLNYALNSDMVKKQEYFRFTGATHHFLDIRSISKLVIPLPPHSEQERIVSILSCVDEAVEKERKRMDRLEQLKRGLMQALLTGKVRVR